LKRKKPAPQKARPANEKRAAPEKPAPPIPPRRLWLFRIMAAVIIPLLVIGGLELVLRLSGFGYPTSYFLKTKIAGKEYYVPNDRFGYRFFPPALTRTPVSLRMAVEKPAHTYRIFVFGESAAMGDPDPTFGAWRYLQVLLNERFPGTDFEVVCVAMTAINSHVILPIARECARRDGDLWIIYMGNNEMVGPFGGGTVFGSRAPGIGQIRTELALKSTKVGQLMDRLTQPWGDRSSTPKTWSGLDMFKDHELRYDDPNRLRAYANFKRNLDDILRAGQDAGVPIILSTVGSNLKDCAPFGSLHSASLTETQKTEWDEIYQEGIALESSGDYSGALKKYEQAAAIDPHYADLNFRAGRCQLALANDAQALSDFEMARDDDALAFRADGRLNQIIEDTAQAEANQGVYFLDAPGMLARHSPGEIPGNELFYEHVHLNFAGNYLLGRAFAEQTLKLLQKSILAGGKSEWASAEFCDQRLAVTPWDRFRIAQDIYSRLSGSPYVGQLNEDSRAQFYVARLKELSSHMTEETRAQSRATYEAALASSPDDYFSRENFAQFLDESGDLADAPAQEQQVSDLLPQNPMTPCIIGRLLVRLGDNSGAEKSFFRSLAIRSDFVPALIEMGLLRANQQKPDEAARFFSRAIRLDSGSVETYLDWGFMEQCGGKLDEAMVHYQQAAKLQPGGPADNFNHAVTLMTEQQPDEAVTYFRQAVWQDQKFWQARYLLGIELAATGQMAEAHEQFSEAAGIRPDFELAHLKNGIILAKLGKLQDALNEFQFTLQLNPANLEAQQNAKAVQANIQALKSGRQP
jgi:tetratricopeptide (TPR) repeat protein